MSNAVAVATTRFTFGSVLGSVNQAATTVTTTLGVLSDSINMVGNYVKDAADKQKVRSVMEMSGYVQSIREEKTVESVLRKKQINQFKRENAENAELWDQEYARLGRALESAGISVE